MDGKSAKRPSENRIKEARTLDDVEWFDVACPQNLAGERVPDAVIRSVFAEENSVLSEELLVPHIGQLVIPVKISFLR